MMSAWPTCLAVSSIMCSSTHRRLRCASGGPGAGCTEVPLSGDLTGDGGVLVKAGDPVLNGVPLTDAEILGIHLVFGHLEPGKLTRNSPPPNMLKNPALPQNAERLQSQQGQRACRRGPAGVRVTDTVHFPDQGRTLQVKKSAQGFPLGSGRELRGRQARRRYPITLRLFQPFKPRSGSRQPAEPGSGRGGVAAPARNAERP